MIRKSAFVASHESVHTRQPTWDGLKAELEAAIVSKHNSPGREFRMRVGCGAWWSIMETGITWILRYYNARLNLLLKNAA